MVSDLLPVILSALVLWLLGLSVFVYRIYVHYRRLGKGIKEANLLEVLNKILEAQGLNQRSLVEVKRKLSEIEKDIRSDIQKVGLVRFNPFSETGGDQSFSLALLDKDDDGIVLSCLHTRDRTRVYAKLVKEGKTKYELSNEERKAIAEAQKK